MPVLDADRVVTRLRAAFNHETPRPELLRLAAELIRERLLVHTRDEVPYGTPEMGYEMIRLHSRDIADLGKKSGGGSGNSGRYVDIGS